MKTYNVDVKRVEHGHVFIEADSYDEARFKVDDGSFAADEVVPEYGYDDEEWIYDEEWGMSVVGEGE